ncbi:MAG: bifunctional [glutamine synthetase] adenylyltransferase/[glutamine synthetase]-adenylyl-L-tyrosine phosphorylase [Acidimicrobiia bacterium]
MTDRRAVSAVPAEEVARLVELAPDQERRNLIVDLVSRGPDPVGAWARLIPILEADPSLVLERPALDRACALAGGSRALSQTVARHPTLLSGVAPDESVTLQVRAALATIAADDLAGAIEMPAATARFSDAIDGVVAGVLARVREEVAVRHPVITDLPFSVVAMGKWGARELNYSSDIDLVFAHDNVDGDETRCTPAALALASAVKTALSAAGPYGPGLQVDADLRPEGSIGPLSRSLESYARYYAKWGEAWELQALLKARPAAGDTALGDRFSEMVETVVWERGLDVDALRSIRRLKEQAEAAAKPSDIKRSRGGIRDVEFSVQLLQLVHGRLDPELRLPATLDALQALTDHGFVGNEDRELLAAAYRFLRDLEHRIQLWDLRQTHDLPDDPERLAQLGRALGMRTDPARELGEKLAGVRSIVRDVHERLYFRPILDALVGSPSARLGVEQAALRLEALGFKDVRAAQRALEELTTGLSRRSQAMHQVLPLMLDWLSLSPDPDLGLAQLRIVLANTPDHAALVTLLQINPLAGERLCQLLGTSRLLGDLIDRIPEFVPRLADERLLGEIRDREQETARLIGLLDSRPDPDARIGTIRRAARRRRLRIAARDILGQADTITTLRSLTDSADAAVAGALHVVTEGDPSGFCVIAMGKWGGGELSYGSDLDLMYVFADERRRDESLRNATELSKVLSEPSRHGEAYSLDADLRPEGRKGPLARSLESYRRYYEEWAEPWETLALVKGRAAVGDPTLCAAWADMVSSHLRRQRLPAGFLRSIREIKARVENERIPAGEDPDYHLKLGRGSISDIEFLTQLLQLRHRGALPDLRVPGTLEALEALAEHDVIEADELRSLRESYLFCTRARLRLHLQMGRAVDSLPTDPDDLRSLSASLGFDRASELRDDYRRVTRRARRVFETRFYE